MNGARPSGAPASYATPKYGPVPSTLPPLPKMRASSVTLPTAVATPGTPCTARKADAGTGGGGDSIDRSTASFLVTTASVPLYEAFDSESAAAPMVSVSVYAPLTIATPSTIAKAVSTVRRRRVPRLFNATRVMRAPS